MDGTYPNHTPDQTPASPTTLSFVHNAVSLSLAQDRIDKLGETEDLGTMLLLSIIAATLLTIVGLPVLLLVAATFARAALKQEASAEGRALFRS